jgi:hypothetical protein
MSAPKSVTPDLKSGFYRAPSSKPPARGAAQELARAFPAMKFERASSGAANIVGEMRSADTEYQNAVANDAALAQTVSNPAELAIYVSNKAKIKGVDAKWIELNQAIISFVSAVSSARTGFKLRDQWSGVKNDPPRDWPYYIANAMQQNALDSKGSNLEQVITQYAPGVIGNSILRAYRALYVAKPKFGNDNLMAYVWTSVKNPLNSLAGVFKSLVEFKIQQLSAETGAAAALRHKLGFKREDDLLKKLQVSCGSLSLDANDCPSTIAR